MWGLHVSNRVNWYKLICHINKTIHTLTTITIIIELSGRGAGRWYERCGGWNKNTTSSEYSITRGVGNRRGRRKTRVVSPVIGQAGCPGREPDYLKPAGTWLGVSARMYNDSNSLGERAKEGRMWPATGWKRICTSVHTVRMPHEFFCSLLNFARPVLSKFRFWKWYTSE